MTPWQRRTAPRSMQQHPLPHCRAARQQQACQRTEHASWTSTGSTTRAWSLRWTAFLQATRVGRTACTWRHASSMASHPSPRSDLVTGAGAQHVPLPSYFPILLLAVAVLLLPHALHHTPVPSLPAARTSGAQDPRACVLQALARWSWSLTGLWVHCCNVSHARPLLGLAMQIVLWPVRQRLFPHDSPAVRRASSRHL